MKLLIVIIVIGIATPVASHDRATQDCIYKVGYHVDPYACAQEQSFIACFECIDLKADLCKQQLQSRCGLSETKAKDECSLGKALSPRICAGEFQS